MDNQRSTLSNAFLYSCESREQQAVEQFVTFHSLIYIQSGSIQFRSVNGTQTFASGSLVLIRRNQLVKTSKVPPKGGQFKSVSIFFKQELLRQYSSQRGIKSQTSYGGPTCVDLPTTGLLTSFFNSLKPYLDLNCPAPIDSFLADLKCLEAVELLLSVRPDLSNLLLDFSDPYKVDLEAYMVQHYMFNVSIDAFAHMTGRSRAGFRRDFARVFHATPGQWLKQKRLEEAYHLIRYKKVNPSMAYLEVGFENLSHFSYVFKQRFGVAPSLVLRGSGETGISSIHS